MKLHKKISEDAAAGAVSAGGGDVAAHPMPLFSKMVKRKIKKNPKPGIEMKEEVEDITGNAEISAVKRLISANEISLAKAKKEKDIPFLIKQREDFILKLQKKLQDLLAKPMKEEVEQLNELSPKTLKNYIAKAAYSAVNKGAEFGFKQSEQDEVDRFTNRRLSNQFKVRDEIKKSLKVDDASKEKVRTKALNRAGGIISAANKLAGKAKVTEAEVSSSGEEFDSTAVMAKFKSLENREKIDPRDTQTFGIEDDNGQTVRVTVGNDQAVEFEKALQSFMSVEDENSSMPEIAEVLFKLKDHFHIVNVEWPEVEEDEEVETEVVGAEGEGEMPPGEPGSEGEMAPVDGEMGAGPDVGEDSAKSLLVQIIDMMKADAEARKQEANAKTAEAKAREADLGVATAMTRVKREEQILDMETYDKQQKAVEKEAKQLAKLAKWQHDMGKTPETEPNDLENYMSQSRGQEEEEMATPTRKALTQTRVKPTDIAGFILSRLK